MTDHNSSPSSTTPKKPSLWQRFKQWPLIAKIGAGLGVGFVALFGLIIILGVLLQVFDSEGVEERAEQAEQDRIEREEEEAAEAERQAEEEAERQAEEERLAEEEAEREAEEEAEREAEEQAEQEAEEEAEREAEEQAEQEAEEERQRQEEEEAAEEEAAATEEEESEPAEAESQFEVEHDDDDLGGLVPGGTTFVRFDIADNFTQGMIASGAARDTCDALEAGLEAHPETGRVAIEGSFPTTDEYGNEDHSVILRPHYEQATLEQINFDRCDAIDVWSLADGGMVHPDLQNN